MRVAEPLLLVLSLGRPDPPSSPYLKTLGLGLLLPLQERTRYHFLVLVQCKEQEEILGVAVFCSKRPLI
jgi:hypothetical protein